MEVSLEVQIVDHKTGNTLYIFSKEALSDIVFSRKLNDIGSISFAVLVDDSKYDYATVFAIDNFIDVYIYEDLTKTKFSSYLVRSIKQTVIYNKKTIIVGGVGLNDLIKRRILDVENDTFGVGGYVTHSDTIHNVLTYLALDHLIDSSSSSRNIPDLTISILNENTNTVGFRDRYINLFELFQKLCANYITNFEIKHTTQTKLVLELGNQGSNKTYSYNFPLGNRYTVLSPEFGNIGSYPSIDIDRTSEQNYVYQLGEGDELNQSILQWSDVEDVAESLYNRIEFTSSYTQSGDNFSTFEDKLTQAIAQLDSNKSRYVITFEVNPFRMLYPISLGDTITLKTTNLQLDSRIVEIKYSMNQLDIKIEYVLEGV